jgi:hypothetical protein
MSRDFIRVWGAPIAVAVMTVLGLIAGLAGDGAWDWLAAACLGLPVLLMLSLGVMRR